MEKELISNCESYLETDVMEHQKLLYFAHLIYFPLRVRVLSLKVWYNNIIGKNGFHVSPFKPTCEVLDILKCRQNRNVLMTK